MCYRFTPHIGLILVSWACFATQVGNISLVLVHAVVADFAFRGSGHKFFSNSAIFAIAVRVMLGVVLTVI